MSTNKFGGDPSRFIYSIWLMTNHLYDTLYHKVSGDSTSMWVNQILLKRLSTMIKLQIFSAYLWTYLLEAGEYLDSLTILGLELQHLGLKLVA